MNITYYQILCKSTNRSYVGSTNNLSKRMAIHRFYYKKYTENGKYLYCSSYEILKGENYEVIPLEIKNFVDMDDYNQNKRRIEQDYISKVANVVNINKALLDPVSKKLYSKNYYKEHRKKILDRQNGYYQDEEKKQRIMKYNREKYHERKLLSQ